MYDFKVIIPGLQLLSTMTSSIMAERSAKCHRPDQSVPEKQAWIVHAGGVAALRAGVSQRVREIQDLICSWNLCQNEQFILETIFEHYSV